MADKQIIDVTKCIHFDKSDIPNGCTCYWDGECNHNCYYKQLKRKEQSEARLVKQIQTICDFINNRPETFKGMYGDVAKIITEYAERKEQKCKELNEYSIGFARKCQKLELDACHLKDKNYNLQRQLDQLKVENEELKKIIERLDVPKHEVIDMHIAMENEKLKVENEELKKQLQAQRAFTRHEQKLIYCVAYDETCKTGNDCKQEKCIFKDNIKLKQTLTEIKDIADKDFRHTAWEEYAKQLKQILQKISECEVEDDRQD